MLGFTLMEVRSRKQQQGTTPIQIRLPYNCQITKRQDRSEQDTDQRVEKAVNEWIY